MAENPAAATHERDIVSFTGFVLADFLEFLLSARPRAELMTASGKLCELTPRATPGSVQQQYHLFLVTLPGFIGIYDAKGYADADLASKLAKSATAQKDSPNRFDFIRFVGYEANYYLSPHRRAPSDVLIGVMLTTCQSHH